MKYIVPLQAWVEVPVEADSPEEAIAKSVQAGWALVGALPIDIIPEENDDINPHDVVVTDWGVGEEGVLKEDVGDLRGGDSVRITKINRDGTLDLERVVEDHEFRVDPKLVDRDES